MGACILPRWGTAGKRIHGPGTMSTRHTIKSRVNLIQSHSFSQVPSNLNCPSLKSISIARIFEAPRKDLSISTVN